MPQYFQNQYQLNKGCITQALLFKSAIISNMKCHNFRYLLEEKILWLAVNTIECIHITSCKKGYVQNESFIFPFVLLFHLFVIAFKILIQSSPPNTQGKPFGAALGISSLKSGNPHLKSELLFSKANESIVKNFNGRIINSCYNTL